MQAVILQGGKNEAASSAFGTEIKCHNVTNAKNGKIDWLRQKGFAASYQAMYRIR
jgi:hypothetical protein